MGLEIGGGRGGRKVLALAMVLLLVHVLVPVLVLVLVVFGWDERGGWLLVVGCAMLRHS